MTPDQWVLWFRLVYGPAAVMNPLFAFWVKMASIATEPEAVSKKKGR